MGAGDCDGMVLPIPDGAEEDVLEILCGRPEVLLVSVETKDGVL